MSKRYQPGDFVIFCKTKHSVHPGPRAKEVDPAPHGEEYTYQVDKYWLVNEVRGNIVVMVTRRGKTHEIPSDHPSLRHANWWERLFYRSRFPAKDNSNLATN